MTSVMVVVTGLTVAGCRPGDVLSVPPPATTAGFGSAHDQRTVEALYNGAKVNLFTALGGRLGTIEWASILSDEFAWSALGPQSNVDARYTSQADQPLFSEPADEPLQMLLTARYSLVLAAPQLAQYEPASRQSSVGEAQALAGFAEVFLAEQFCAGMTLSQPLPGGGFQYGTPLTTDSLLGTAEAHFALALAAAHGNDTVVALASVGLGRARLDRGRFADAAAAVTGVPTTFLYNIELARTIADNVGLLNLYGNVLPGTQNCPEWNVADRDGENGLNFVSAHDDRLVLDSTLQQTCDAQYLGILPGTWYYPTKFGEPTSTGLIPLATGVEARLIAAEAALAANDATTWANDLNALRAAAPSTYLQLASGMDPLKPDSSTTASAAKRVDVMFRERAFWLFGTGTRLGDMRRLIRQYGRDQHTVFPIGPYPNGHSAFLPAPLPSYGIDVSLTLPTRLSQTPVTNPYYKGCIAPTSSA